MFIVKMLIILIIAGNKNCTGFLDSLTNLRNKANKMKHDVDVFTERSHNASVRFIKKSELLYPGLDKDKVAQIQKLWKDYYECQQAFYEASVRLIVPDAVDFFESTNAMLECGVCESPREMFLDTIWLYSAEYNMDNIREINYNDNIFIKNNSLNIINIKRSNGGLYVCQKGNHFARPYILHVFDQERSKKVVPFASKDGDHPAEDLVLKELNATLTTRWGEWTQCSRCDKLGKQTLRGTCTLVSNKNIPVKLPTAHNETNPIRRKRTVTENSEGTTETVTSTTSQTQEPPYIICNTTDMPILHEQRKLSQKSTNMSVKVDLELLEMFEEGIPCQSKMLSEAIRNLEDVINRSSEIMIIHCQVPCPKDILFVVVDEKGNVLESANNSDGVYSVLQGIPQSLPSVSRTVEFVYNKDKLKLKCPGNLNGDIPVEWYVEKQALSNEVLDSEKNGRVKIDEYNRIVFKAVMFNDSKIYSCWQRDELVGTVRLIVEEKYNLNYQWNIMVIGTIIIFYTFGSIYYKVFSRRKQTEQ